MNEVVLNFFKEKPIVIPKILLRNYKNSKENYVNNENIIEIKRYKDNILITNEIYR